MQGFQRPIGPTPGALRVGGMGGPVDGMTNLPTQSAPFSGLLDWLRFQGAAGYGMGPYGYPLSYGVAPLGQQNMMLNQQWGIDGIGQHPGMGGYGGRLQP